MDPRLAQPPPSYDEHSPSAPGLPSPLPPPPPPVSVRQDTLAGWVPADSDSSTRAADARGRSALRKVARLEQRVEKHGSELSELASAVGRLDATMARLVKVLIFLGTPFVLTLVGLCAKAVWDWLTTLHH